MIINLERIRPYTGLMSSTYSLGGYQNESVYIDFTDSCLYMGNEEINVRVRFDFDLEEGDEDIESMFIEIPPFVAICNLYDKITFRKVDNEGGAISYSFSSGEEYFVIPVYLGSDTRPDFDFDGFNVSGLSEHSFELIREASRFTGSELTDKNLDGISVNDIYVLSADQYTTFVGFMDSSVLPFNLRTSVVKILGSIPYINSMNIFTSEDDPTKIGIDINSGEARLNVPCMMFLSTSDMVRTPNFIEICGLSYDTSFYFNKVDMLSILKFFEPFVKMEINQLLEFIVVNNSTVEVSAHEGMQGKRILSIEECPEELIGASFLFNRKVVSSLISTIKDEVIRLEMIANSKSVFVLMGKEKRDSIIGVAKYQ